MSSTDRTEEPRESRTSRLVREIASGEQQRFGDLYARVAPAVYTWARLQMSPSLSRLLDADDVVSEVWCRALVGFASYDSERASFRTWIFGIANHVLLEVFRRQRRGEGGPGAAASDLVTPEDLPEEATSISRRVARDESLRVFVTRVGELDHEERNLLLYHGLEGLSHERVASLIGISAEAAAKRWQRVVARLRALEPPEGLLTS